MKNRLRTAMICGLAVWGTASARADQGDSKSTGTIVLTQSEYEKARSCQENLTKMDGSKEQFALEFRLSNNSPISWANILDPNATGKLGQGYLKAKPVCPAGGTYALKNIGQTPVCSLGDSKGHVLEGGGAEIVTTTTLSQK